MTTPENEQIHVSSESDNLFKIEQLANEITHYMSSAESGKRIKSILVSLPDSPNEKQLEILKQALNNATEIYLSELTPANIKNFCIAFKGNESATRLSITNCEMDPQTFKMLSQILSNNKTIESLSLTGSEIERESLSDFISLARNKALEFIYTWDIPLFADEGFEERALVEAVQKDPNLITEQEFNKLKFNKASEITESQVRSILTQYANQTPVSNDGSSTEISKEAQEIAKIEQAASEITSSMPFWESAKKISSLLKIMRKNPSEQQKRILKNALSQVSHLSISLEDFNEIDMLNLSHPLKDNESIAELTLSGLKIGQKELKVLSKVFKENKKINSINLMNNNIGLESANYLIKILKNKTIAHVYLHDNPLAEDSETLIDQIRKNPRLMTYKECSKISIKDRKAYETLLKITKEQTIVRKLSQISSSTDDKIKNKKLLKLLSFMNDNPSEALKSLLKRALDKFTTLDFNYKSFKTLEVAHLCEALENNRSVTQLNLKYADIQEADAKKLHSLLANNTTLLDLDLSNNNLIEEETLNLIEQRIEHNKSLIQETSFDKEAPKADSDSEQSPPTSPKPLILSGGPSSSNSTSNPQVKEDIMLASKQVVPLKKRRLKIAALSAAIIGAVTSAALFIFATPSLALMALGAFGAVTLVSLGLSKFIKEKPAQISVSAQSANDAAREPAKIVEVQPSAKTANTAETVVKPTEARSRFGARK